MKLIDKIRTMTPRELAEFIYELDLCVVCTKVEKEIECFDCSKINDIETYVKYFNTEV